MKKWLKWCIWTAGLVILSTAGLYLVLALCYKDVFAPGTWLNGVYCTGMSVEAAAEELAATSRPPEIRIEGADGRIGVIRLTEEDYDTDFERPLRERLEKQESFFWALYMLNSAGEEVRPSIVCREEALRAYWSELAFVKEELARKDGVEILLTEEGYALRDGASRRLRTEEAFACLLRKLEQGEQTLKLEEEGLYRDKALTAEEEKTLKLWEQIQAFQDCGIVYRMWKEDVPLNASVACRFLETDEGGMPLLDEEGLLCLSREGIADFVEELADRYDTYGKERRFFATRGEWVTVSGGTYGVALDREAEKEYLEAFFLESRTKEGREGTGGDEAFGETEIHLPAYRVDTRREGADDIGDCYIEIDMTSQKLYYYRTGDCLLETDIVTGNTGKRRGTPQGVNYVYAKQKNRTLRGEDYAAFVRYWMPVKGNVGIHDASWRSTFGGTIYKTAGSHGCINVPSSVMGELYDMVEVGTPVVMFY